MAKIIKLPDNFIGKEDHERLEAFGGHEISRGRATRWHWDKTPQGGDVLQIFRGGAREELVVQISRDRQHDAFCVKNAAGRVIVTGTLDHVMAELDGLFAKLHGEEPA